MPHPIFGEASLLVKRGAGAATLVPAAEALASAKHVLLYFSAHWCPPCRGFTPALCKWYEAHRAEGIEVVFISGDRSDEQFSEYYGEMPFCALPFEDRALQEALSEKYGVEGIPALMVLDPAVRALGPAHLPAAENAPPPATPPPPSPPPTHPLHPRHPTPPRRAP